MPSRNSAKKTLEEIAAQEDSNDDDYDDSAPGHSAKRRTARSRTGNRPAIKRKKRGGYSGSDVDSDGDSLVEDDFEAYDSDEDEEEIETNEKGRPQRRSAQKAVQYEEKSGSEEEDELALDDSDSDPQPATPPRRKRKLVVTLKMTPEIASRIAPGTRRRRSGENRGEWHGQPQRRSRRLSHDEDEDVVALSSSGRHVEVVRPGSRGSDFAPRATRGGKGIKYPSKSTIDEVDEPESGQPMLDADDEMEIAPSQHEIMDSLPASQVEPENERQLPRLVSDIDVDPPEDDEEDMPGASAQLTRDDPEAANNNDQEDEEDEDEDGPVLRGRLKRGPVKRKAESPPAEEPTALRQKLRSSGRLARQSRKAQDESSDFEPAQDEGDEAEITSSSDDNSSPRKGGLRDDDYASSNGGKRSTRARRAAATGHTSSSGGEHELAAELADLTKDTRRRRPAHEQILFEPRGTRRGQKKPNYDLLRNIIPIEEEEDVAAQSPSNRARKTGGGTWQRPFLNTYGPFGGGGLAPVLGGPGAARGQRDDSDSSDDEVMKQPKPLGGAVGMTPTQPSAAGFNPFALQPLNSDVAQAPAGTPANLGRVKDKQALADADPLGVDQNVTFEGVGGLQGHIDQLKEMVTLPLLYPEIFMRFKITPPRGVLFHGPPGTGKTLLARALASSVSSHGRKVTFYMRKGADALSKWVGEAERQLRLLFEEARKNQPSIIFFDEIDGLAPVRSSKQEQIHASIVSTLLALMDGMDGRGQVIVIGATNRPDNIDPALRRPGRFDREFYFPLPNTEARRAILDIHTKGWNPPLDPKVKDELAGLTKGYGGADLRALCTEAALNAVQRRYPQIYSANEKLLIDPKTIEVIPKDFMISIKKMVPSSERSASSGAAPLPKNVEPLLRQSVNEISAILAEMLPLGKKYTALEEAQFEDVASSNGFGRERMQQAFETTRVFRPRLLVHGKVGMGQQYVAAAILNHFEGIHVQSFDLATLLSDSTASAEATVIRLFAEVKRHKPSVIFVPNVQEWYGAVGPQVLSTFFGLLRSIKPTDPVLLLGLVEYDHEGLDAHVKRELFGYSKKNSYQLQPPSNTERLQFFLPLRGYIQTAPSDFPDPENRKKRALEILQIAPPEPEKSTAVPSKEELKAQKKRDRQTLNMLKIRLQPIMDQIRTRYKKFRSGVIEESQIRYLFEEADPGTVTSDLHTDLRAQASFRPFEIGRDGHGVPGLVDQANNKFYYNLDSVTIEKRLSNGYYKRPKDFLADIKRLAKDAKAIGDEDRLLKANELLANVEVDIGGIEFGDPAFTAECEKVYQREVAREKEALEKIRAEDDGRDMPPPQAISNVPPNPSSNTNVDGPIFLGEAIETAKDTLARLAPATPTREDVDLSRQSNGVLQITQGHEHGTDLRDNSNHTGSGHEADVEGETSLHGTESQTNSNDQRNETQKTNTTSSYDNRGSAQPRPYHSYTAPSQQLRREAGMSQPLSQTEYLTPMQRGSTAADYQNDASTTQTTSGKKTSSGERDQNNTQDSGPNLYLYNERYSAGGSEIPDTQENGNELFSQASIGGPLNSQHLQPRPPSSQSAPPVPVFEDRSNQSRTNGHLAEILNPQPEPNLIQAGDAALDKMIREIADRTTGMTVEQLEQVNSVMMDTLWRTRSEWDRGKVMTLVIEAFNEVTDDMMQCGQEFGSGSWGRGTQD